MALVEYFREPDVRNRCCVVIFVGAVKMLQKTDKYLCRIEI